jgi:hypothetical protein
MLLKYPRKAMAQLQEGGNERADVIVDLFGGVADQVATKSDPEAVIHEIIRAGTVRLVTAVGLLAALPPVCRPL